MPTAEALFSFAGFVVPPGAGVVREIYRLLPCDR